MKLLKWLFFFLLTISSLIIYHWHNQDHWQTTLVKKNIVDWNQGLAVALIKHNNYYKIQILESDDHVFINLEDWNIEYIFLDENMGQLQKLNGNNSIIYIIITKIPMNFIQEYIEKNKLILASPFIIINESYDKVLIHKYFFNKSKEPNDFVYTSLVDVNQLVVNQESNNDYLEKNHNTQTVLLVKNPSIGTQKKLRDYEQERREIHGEDGDGGEPQPVVGN
jgi:hypothetical protein